MSLSSEIIETFPIKILDICNTNPAYSDQSALVIRTHPSTLRRFKTYDERLSTIYVQTYAINMPVTLH